MLYVICFIKLMQVIEIEIALDVSYDKWNMIFSYWYIVVPLIKDKCDVEYDEQKLKFDL